MTAATEPKLRIASTFPAVLYIDGAALDVRVKRMTNAEFDDFELGYDKWSSATAGPEPETVAQRIARQRGAEAWLRETLAANLTIADGQLVKDDQPVTDGAELLSLFGARRDVVPSALTVIYMENRLSEEEKKTYRSALASLITSLTAPLEAASGTAPAPTAASAAPPHSASAAAVMDGAGAPSSGTTDPSGCEPVPSEV
jgi:hypothetical protein